MRYEHLFASVNEHLFAVNCTDVILGGRWDVIPFSLVKGYESCNARPTRPKSVRLLAARRRPARSTSASSSVRTISTR
jgi:hypothetical protein